MGRTPLSWGNNMVRNHSAIVIFDGQCNLCNRVVQFLIRYDKQKNLIFTSNHSTRGKYLLRSFAKEKNNINTLYFLLNDKIYKQSSAAIAIARHLGLPWNGAIVLSLIPRSARDYFYNLLAHNRYKLSMENEHCMVKNETANNRFPG